ncbi:Tn3 family transposase [Azospirillum sp. Marseille-Q6669]
MTPVSQETEPPGNLARFKQRKLIKYNHLVSNLLIFHTIASMTRALDQMAIEEIAVDADALANLSPYQTEHINRFGHYTLNFARVPAPLPSQIAVPSSAIRGALRGHFGSGCPSACRCVNFTQLWLPSPCKGSDAEADQPVLHQKGRCAVPTVFNSDVCDA